MPPNTHGHQSVTLTSDTVNAVCMVPKFNDMLYVSFSLEDLSYFTDAVIFNIT
jgi:hypothetical protein